MRRAFHAQLFADHFYEDAFRTATVEFAIKDLFPRAEIELPFGDGHDNFAAHNLPLVMCIGVVFTRAIVVITFRRWIEWSKLFQPFFVITVQTGFVVVEASGPALELYKFKRADAIGESVPKLRSERFEDEYRRAEQIGGTGVWENKDVVVRAMARTTCGTSDVTFVEDFIAPLPMNDESWVVVTSREVDEESFKRFVQDHNGYVQVTSLEDVLALP